MDGLNVKPIEELLRINYAYRKIELTEYDVLFWKALATEYDLNESEVYLSFREFMQTWPELPLDPECVFNCYRKFMRRVDTELHWLKIRTEIGGVWKK